MTHLHWAVLYPGMWTCYIRLRSGWGSDGNVYNVLRGLRLLETKRGMTPNHWTPLGRHCDAAVREFVSATYGRATRLLHFAVLCSSSAHDAKYRKHSFFI